MLCLTSSHSFFPLLQIFSSHICKNLLHFLSYLFVSCLLTGPHTDSKDEVNSLSHTSNDNATHLVKSLVLSSHSTTLPAVIMAYIVGSALECTWLASQLWEMFCFSEGFVLSLFNPSSLLITSGVNCAVDKDDMWGSGMLKVTKVLNLFRRQCLEIKFSFFFSVPHVGYFGGPEIPPS